MFDSQKLSFNAFVDGFKHGVYVFTQDTCQICHDYKESIKDIDNCYLYFVEVPTSEDESTLSEMIDSIGFPVTVGYNNGEICFVRRGMLFEADFSEVMKFLKKFGDAPLPPDEVERRHNNLKNKCEVTYYAFPKEVDPAIRSRWMNELAIKYNELPIDISTVGIGLSLDEREHMLEGQYQYVKLVVFKDGKSSLYDDPFIQRVILDYSIVNMEMKFIERHVNEWDEKENKNEHV